MRDADSRFGRMKPDFISFKFLNSRLDMDSIFDQFESHRPLSVNFVNIKQEAGDFSVVL